MTDLHLDNKVVTLKCTRNLFRVNATIFVPKDVCVSNSYYEDKIHDNIYLPLTMHRCLVLKNARINSLEAPEIESIYDPLLQEVELVGEDMEMISMDEYWKLAKISP
jgi:hypothetical protein